MKKLLLTIVLVLAVAIPAFAQNGPVKIKPLMTYTENANQPSPNFYLGISQYVTSATHREVKGTGSYRVKLEVLNSSGVSIYKINLGPYDVNSPAFTYVHGYTDLPMVIFTKAGYYTLKCVYRDVATGYTWSHQTKIHVME